MGRPRLDLDDVDTLGIADARNWWVRLHGAPAPSIALPLLKLGLAHRVQADVAGLRNRGLRAFMEAPRKGRAMPSRKLTPGTWSRTESLSSNLPKPNGSDISCAAISRRDQHPR